MSMLSPLFLLLDLFWEKKIIFSSFFFFLQYRQAVKGLSGSVGGPRVSPSNTSTASSSSLISPSSQMGFNPLQQKQRSFLTFGFGAGGSGPSRRESHVNVNVTPTSHDIGSDTPEIRKYKKRFNSEILCAALWGEFSTIPPWLLFISNHVIMKVSYAMMHNCFQV